MLPRLPRNICVTTILFTWLRKMTKSISHMFKIGLMQSQGTISGMGRRDPTAIQLIIFQWKTYCIFSSGSSMHLTLHLVPVAESSDVCLLRHKICMITTWFKINRSMSDLFKICSKWIDANSGEHRAMVRRDLQSKGCGGGLWMRKHSYLKLPRSTSSRISKIPRCYYYPRERVSSMRIIPGCGCG